MTSQVSLSGITCHVDAWSGDKYIPPKNLATQASMADRKVLDVRRWYV